jgi:AcrR family transcriptional regulator
MTGRTIEISEVARSSAYRAGLDTAHVIRAAADMIDKRGWKSLKLSDLADYLGVRAPSLYSHIGGLPELKRELQLMSLKKMEKCLGWALAGRDRDAAVLALAQSYREFATEHPGLYEIMMKPIDKADAELENARLEVVRIARACLVGYSLSEDDEWHVIRAIRSVVHGFVSLECDGHFERPIDENESFRRLIGMIVDGIAGLNKKIDEEKA